MKYIIFERIDGIALFPIVFPEIVRHCQIGERFGGEKNVNSSGYISFGVDCDGITAECYGVSIDYQNKPPAQGDAEIILASFKNRE